MQLKRLIVAVVAAIVTTFTLAATSACGTSNYAGEGMDFSFIATVTNIDVYNTGHDKSDISLTVEHLSDIKGGASDWFKHASSYRLYSYYHGDGGAYFSPGEDLDTRELNEGSRAKFSGRVRADSKTSGQHDASGFGHATDRPVFEKVTLLADKS